MQKTANVQPAVVPVVRVLRLKRRRTNVPWIYSLYHADPKPRRRRARELAELDDWLEAEGLMGPDDGWGEEWAEETGNVMPGSGRCETGPGG